MCDDAHKGGVAGPIRFIGHGRPREVKGVQSDDGGLQEARARLMFLNFGEDGYNGNCNTKDQVQADEDLVFCAVVRFGVEDVEQHGKDDRQDIEEACKRQQGSVPEPWVSFLHSIYPQFIPRVSHVYQEHQLD